MTKDEKEALIINFGKVVRDLRKARGLTGRQLAERCKINDSNITKIEKGKRESTLTTMAALAGGLGVSLPEIFRLLKELPDKP
jgi:transcriptional regulator with XRE-family HTH domain